MATWTLITFAIIILQQKIIAYLNDKKRIVE